MTRTRLLIVDDHASVRAGLRFLLSGEDDFEIVGEAFSVATALTAIDSLAPEIVVLDFGLGTQTAARVLDQLAVRPNAPRVLMLSMEDERVVGQELARRGAVEYVMKQSPTDEILAALRRIRSALHSAATRPRPPAAAAPVHLTKREREVLLLVKEGLPSKTIARRLQISEKTVDVHKHKLRRKLHLRTESELARHAALFAADVTQR
jgi:DNA-binding NarL/FixJ family response regulator